MEQLLDEVFWVQLSNARSEGKELVDEVLLHINIDVLHLELKTLHSPTRINRLLSSVILQI